MDHKPSTIPFQMFGSTLRWPDTRHRWIPTKDAIVIKKPTNSMKFHPGHWQTGMRTQNGGCFFGVNFLYGQKHIHWQWHMKTLLNWHLFDCYGNKTPKYFAFLRLYHLVVPQHSHIKNTYISRSIAPRIVWGTVPTWNCLLIGSCWGGERYLQGSFF